MQVRFFPFAELNAEHRNDYFRALDETLQSSQIILGEQVQRFEKEVESFLGVNGRFTSCHSGTDALRLSLIAGDVGRGDEVLVPSLTANATAAAIVSMGARPVFCDIDEKTFLMDASECLRKVTAKTKAIIPVHLYGNLFDVAALRSELIRLGREDVIVVEDCAQSFGSFWKEKENNVFSGTRGHFGAYSFYPTKNLGALGEGGGVCAQGFNQTEKLVALRQYGQNDKTEAVFCEGINSRLDVIQAAFLSIKLKKFWNEQEVKARLHRQYVEELKELFDVVSVPVAAQNVFPCWHLFVLRFLSEQDRAKTQSILNTAGIQTRVHYPLPCHKQKAFAPYAEDVCLPNTEQACKTILSLPFHSKMKEEDLLYVVRNLKTALSSGK